MMPWTLPLCYPFITFYELTISCLFTSFDFIGVTVKFECIFSTRHCTYFYIFKWHNTIRIFILHVLPQITHNFIYIRFLKIIQTIILQNHISFFPRLDTPPFKITPPKYPRIYLVFYTIPSSLHL
jgi:hypothetical protein